MGKEEPENMGFKTLKIKVPKDHFQEGNNGQGNCITTPGTRNLPEEDIMAALRQYHTQDWGEMTDPDDLQQNQEAFRNGRPKMHGVYTATGERIWIMGYRNQPATIFLPSEH